MHTTKTKTWCWWEEEDALWTVALSGNARKCIEALMKEEKSVLNMIKPLIKCDYYVGSKK